MVISALHEHDNNEPQELAPKPPFVALVPAEMVSGSLLQSTSFGNNNTQSAVNLDAPYTTLNLATHNFAQALIDWAPYYRTEITNARNAAPTFSIVTDIDLWDYADWVGIYTGNASLDATSQAVKDAVLAAVIR